MLLSKITQHLRREFMSGVDRDQLRVKVTGEVFTPTLLVREMLAQLPQDLFVELESKSLDPSCGDGQFLSEVLIRKCESCAIGDIVADVDFESALGSIYGVDLMPDNVQLCRDRLLCGQEKYRDIVNRNIVCHDALTYDYSFNGTNYTDAELREEQLGTKGAMVKKQHKSKKVETKPNLSCFE